MVKKYEIDFAGRPLTIEIGKMARQAHGSCTLTYGDAVVLVTACRGNDPVPNADFMPLTVNYVEMNYAAGKIPGGFFKREGRSSEREVLCSRLIDRPLRPVFEDGYAIETQVIATVISVDSENDPELMALVGASIALGISDIPFLKPLAAVRVGRIDGKLVCNPTKTEQLESEIDLLVAGGDDGIVMVEGGADFASEEVLVEALAFAEESMKPVLDEQRKIIAECGEEKMQVSPPEVDEALAAKVKEVATDRLVEALAVPDKIKRYAKLDAVKKEIVAELLPEFEERDREIKDAYGTLKYNVMREAVLSTKVRVDGRDPLTVRDITSEVGLLPRTHGSALFTRGETQALVVATLGTSDDEQRIDALTGWEYKNFILHYNFPPYSVGEARFLRGPGRREVGHGALAERAVKKIVQNGEDFPYTVRIVSDILESNGSSSMASVCGASLALMDAGVPVKDHVAGIAMGLIKEGDRYVVLSDILGDEDHIGDMDFKVAGTKEGVTALQMDIKIGGITAEILKEALFQAKDGRLHILGEMEKAITSSRGEISEFAPRIISIMVNPERIKDVIGPGGKNIKSIVQQTGVKIDVDDTGKVNIASSDEDAAKKAIAIVKSLTQDAEIDKLYMGTVKKIMDFGAFVEIFPGTDGLVHISQIAEERVENVRDVLKEGEEVLVKCLEVDRSGKIRLSIKAALGETLPED
ncbi:MAG: polyribonucleotide nucleotidyltransferase [Deltaproteobacteria bacterium]|nr:polyribonucleotide nucleotidyltransferase [Deltaproteobacteria bacterium]